MFEPVRSKEREDNINFREFALNNKIIGHNLVKEEVIPECLFLLHNVFGFHRPRRRVLPVELHHNEDRHCEQIDVLLVRNEALEKLEQVLGLEHFLHRVVPQECQEQCLRVQSDEKRHLHDRAQLLLSGQGLPEEEAVQRCHPGFRGGPGNYLRKERSRCLWEEPATQNFLQEPGDQDFLQDLQMLSRGQSGWSFLETGNLWGQGPWGGWKV